MKIGSFRRTSLVDFPGVVASAVFVSGCNFRCPFCHNPELVLGSSEVIPESEVLGFLEHQRRFVDGVCVSGGEPTLYPDLPDFLRKLKSMGFKVKLDTNGYNPDMLSSVISEGLVDYVAMDLKSSLDSYGKCAGVTVDAGKVVRSVKILMESEVDYEFRTTVVPGLFDLDELKGICDLIKGAKNYFLQQFRSRQDLVSRDLEGVKPYSVSELEEFAAFARGFVKNCAVRGV